MIRIRKQSIFVAWVAQLGRWLQISLETTTTCFVFFSEGRWVTQPAVARKCVKSSLFVHRVAEMSFGIARNIKGTNE